MILLRAAVAIAFPGVRLALRRYFDDDRFPRPSIRGAMEGSLHQPQDVQSLLMHQEAVRLIGLDEALIERLLATLRRWDRHASARSRPLRDAWVDILEQRDWRRALEVSERGNQLRQASPMATLLGPQARYAIIRQVRSRRTSSNEAA